jgi:hypothetical protein
LVGTAIDLSASAVQRWIAWLRDEAVITAEVAVVDDGIFRWKRYPASPEKRAGARHGGSAPSRYC